MQLKMEGYSGAVPWQLRSWREGQRHVWIAVGHWLHGSQVFAAERQSATHLWHLEPANWGGGPRRPVH